MLVTFALLRGMGGSPFRLEDEGVPPALQAQLEEYYGLEDAWFVEFAHYARNVATLDFGPSLVNRYTTVDQIVEERFPVSGELVLLACVWAIPLGVALGLLGALRRNTWLDYVVTTLATSMLVVPVFLVAGVASTYFIREWGLVEAGWNTRQAKVLPSFVLALAPAGYIARLVRAAAVETMQLDYVRTARAKGLTSRRILLLHVLPGSLVPFLGAAVPMLALLVTGTFFVERAFGIPGAAQYFVSAALQRDYPMVMGMTVALAAVVIAANLLADLARFSIDPRLRDERA
jgi:ABC-type dipeptide/oligopeptide/nickel transport system permease component